MPDDITLGCTCAIDVIHDRGDVAVYTMNNANTHIVVVAAVAGLATRAGFHSTNRLTIAITIDFQFLHATQFCFHATPAALGIDFTYLHCLDDRNPLVDVEEASFSSSFFRVC